MASTHKKGKSKTKDINKQLYVALCQFVERHPPRRLRHNLTNLFLESISERDAVDLPYLQDLAFDLQGLFELLDISERELQG